MELEELIEIVGDLTFRFGVFVGIVVLVLEVTGVTP